MWELRVVVLLMILVGACKEIPVDNSTANVIRRTRDTVVYHDVKVERDTTIRLDTVISINHDTLVKRDTIINTRTIIKTDTVISRDTVIQKDTLRIRDTLTHRDTIHLNGDTLWLHDTLRIRDTVVKRDTVKRIDTLIHRDTIVHVDTIRLVSTELPRSGTLYRLLDNHNVLSMPVDIDELSRLTVDLQGTSVVAVQLKLLARVTATYDTVAWGEIGPSWLYMITGRVELVGGAGRKGLTADPWNNPTYPGIAVLPRVPYNRRWLTIGSPPSEGSFNVTSVDATGRFIYGYIKARFPDNACIIDSLALKFRY